MWQENKNFIMKVLVVMVAVILVGKFSFGDMERMHMGWNPGGADQNVITVTGEGKINTAPDIATVNFTITKDGKTVEDAQKAVAEVEGKVLVALRALSIEDKDIKTDSSSFNPKYDYGQVICNSYPCPQKSPKIIGYEAYESLTVKIRNIDNAGKVIEEIGKTGVTNLYGPNFALENEDAKKAEARKIAIDDARAKAEKLAKDLGVRLGKLQSFNENSGGYPIAYAKLESADAVAGSAPTAELPKGENTITSNVTLTYSIR